MPATARHHRLVLEAMPLVEQKAKKLCAKYQGLVEYDDLCTVGKLAAYDSASRYKAGRNRSFPRFARLRIYGAMMGEIKCETEAARMKRDMIRALANYLADYDDDFNILQHDKPEIQRRLDLMAANAALVMFLVAGEHERMESARDKVADADEHAVAIEALREVHAALEPEQRELLSLLFVQGFDQHKVGERTGVAHETVCRRLGRLLGELRRSLKQRRVTHAPPPAHLAGMRPVLDAPAPDASVPDEPPPPRGLASLGTLGADQGRTASREPEGAGPGGRLRPER